MNDSEFCERKRYLLWNQQNKCVVAWKVTNLPESTFWQRRNIPTSKLKIKHAWKSRKKIRELSWCFLPDLKLLRQRLIVLLLPLLDHLILLFPPLVHHTFRGNLVPQFLTDLIARVCTAFRIVGSLGSEASVMESLLTAPMVWSKPTDLSTSSTGSFNFSFSSAAWIAKFEFSMSAATKIRRIGLEFMYETSLRPWEAAVNSQPNTHSLECCTHLHSVFRMFMLAVNPKLRCGISSSFPTTVWILRATSMNCGPWPYELGLPNISPRYPAFEFMPKIVLKRYFSRYTLDKSSGWADFRISSRMTTTTESSAFPMSTWSRDQVWLGELLISYVYVIYRILRNPVC